MVLFVNACVRPQSRTWRLAKRVLKKLGGVFVEVNLEKEGIMPLTGESLSLRNSLLEQGAFDNPIFRHAKQFMAADTIVIAAPFWDLAFPASLKCYLESVCISGLSFVYTESGDVCSCCKAQRLIYVTTSGGPFLNNECGWRYINALSDTFFGIKEKILVKAENLDIIGADVEAILSHAETEIENLSFL